MYFHFNLSVWIFTHLQFKLEITEVLVQSVQLLEIRITKLEVQNVKVLLDAFTMYTLGNGHSASLDQETVENLWWTE